MVLVKSAESKTRWKITVRQPTTEDLKRHAQSNHFEMTDADIRAFEAMIPGLFDSHDALSRYDLLLMPATPMPAHRNDAGGDPQAVI